MDLADLKELNAKQMAKAENKWIYIPESFKDQERAAPGIPGRITEVKLFKKQSTPWIPSPTAAEGGGLFSGEGEGHQAPRQGRDYRRGSLSYSL